MEEKEYVVYRINELYGMVEDCMTVAEYFWVWVEFRAFLTKHLQTLLKSGEETLDKTISMFDTFAPLGRQFNEFKREATEVANEKIEFLFCNVTE